jgi:glycosyltransferase involved in cell wall biosynthesis
MVGTCGGAVGDPGRCAALSEIRSACAVRFDHESHSAGRVAADVCSGWLELLRGSMARRRTIAATMTTGGSRSTSVEPSIPAVSVIVTVRNGMPYLPEAIAAIRRQTLSPREIVAMVGCSEDGTLEYLRSESGISVVEQSGLGLAAARNAALEAVESPFVAFCDYDDLWHSSKLEKQAAVIAQFNAPAACIVNFEEFADGASAHQPTNLSGGIPRLGWTPSALLAHRDVFTAVGPFDPALGLGCDTDWFRRLQRSDIPCGIAGRVLLRKRRHAVSLSSDPGMNRAAMFKMIRKMRSESKHGR